VGRKQTHSSGYGRTEGCVSNHIKDIVMYDLDEISDDYDLDIVIIKYEGTKRLMDELSKHFYLDLLVAWGNKNWWPQRLGKRFNNLSRWPVLEEED
jgi:hypothetical protein